MPSLTKKQQQQAISLIRGLAMDAPFYAKSGHQGTAMALAPLAHVLFSRVMRHDPNDPTWADRDRFILSNGHASILHYAMLFLSGYGLQLDDLRAFRQWGSSTPGHPEVGHTAGVEVTTGPLGQGFANAVGMAIAERQLRAEFGDKLVNHHTFVIAGDGCLMEGVSHEAASLAGHLGLGQLVVVYDDNKITIDGNTSLAYSDDAATRFEAYGWHVERLGEIADDCDALEAALRRGMAERDRPSLLVLNSHIGHPSPDLTDNHTAHGNPFTLDQINRTKAAMHIPNEPFWAPTELVAAYRAHVGARGEKVHGAWKQRCRAAGSRGTDLRRRLGGVPRKGWDRGLPTWAIGESIATRVAVEKAFNASVDTLPGLMAGAADLTGNTGTKLAGQHPQSAATPEGRQVFYGVREHAMGAAMVGMALHGGVLPVGGTFFVFADYMRPAIRLAALSRAKVVFVFTHDSVGVGEDGPTHQPIEQLASLRAIPGLQVIRPADANETMAAWRATVAHDGPTALILSRQNVVVTTDGSAVEAGAGEVTVDGARCRAPQVVLVGTGSEVAVCVDAARKLAGKGIRAKVVSMPSWDRFASASSATRRAVLGKDVPAVSVEAGVTMGWSAFADVHVGIDRFGASAPGSVVFDKLGINVTRVVAAATSLVSRKGR